MCYAEYQTCSRFEKLHGGSKGDLRLSHFPQSEALLATIVDFETDHRFLICENHTAFHRMKRHEILYPK